MTPAERYAAAARSAARQIVERPPFARSHAGPGAFTRFVDAIGHGIVTALRWIGHQLQRFIAHPVSHGAHAAFGGWTGVALVVLVSADPGPSPVDVALAYEQAWDHLDFEGLWSLSGDELRDGLRRPEFVAAKNAA